MIGNHWPAEFLSHTENKWPRDYLAIDIETSGFSRKKDVVLEIAHVLVQDGRVTDTNSMLLDWTKTPEVSQQWLMSAIYRVSQQIGSQWSITYARLAEEGCTPRKVLQYYQQLLQACRENKIAVLGHNVQAMDLAFLNTHFSQYLGTTFEPDPYYVWDTGALAKATMMYEDLRYRSKTLPQPGETPAAYCQRLIHANFPGGKWKLENCLEYLGLVEKRALDLQQAHSALFDAFASHYVMDEFYQQWTAPHLQEDSLATPEAFERMLDAELADARLRREQQQQAQQQKETAELAPARPPQWRRQRQRPV